MITEAGPVQPQPDPEAAKTRALAALRQALWEADQFITHVEIREYVGRVLREIESDRP